MNVKINNQQDLTILINDLERKLEENFLDKSISYWNQILRKTHKDPNLIDEERAKILLNPEYRFAIEDWVDKVDEKLQKRKLELLKLEFLRARVSSEPQIFALKNKLDYQIINFIPEVDGKQYSRSELYNMIEKSDDPSFREKAWKSLTSQGKELEGDVELLFNLRNEKAAALGYKNYGDLSLYLDDLSKEKLYKLFDNILTLTEKPYKKLVEDCKDKLNVSKVYPWDIKYYQYKYFTSLDDSYFPKDGIIKSMEMVLQKFNLKLSSLPVTLEYCDIPYGAMSLTIKPGKDVRVLANPQEGYNWYETLYHEFGHTLHNSFITIPSFIISTGESNSFREGMGCIFQKFMSEEVWLKEQLNLSEEVISKFLLQNKMKNCYWLRRLVTDFLFEYSVYDNPSGDLKERYREYNRKHLFLELPDDYIWAHDPVYVAYPLYLQHYLLAEVIAYQTINYYKERNNTILCPDFLEFLKKFYFKDGGLKRWEEKVKDATGKKLKAESLTRMIENI